MLVEDPRVCEKLRRIVTTLTADRALQDDLMQESLIHMWRTENENPGHTQSWYLQNCRYHLRRWLSSGRSLDSFKRCKGDLRVSLDVLDDGLPFDGYHTNGELIAGGCADDIVFIESVPKTSVGKFNKRALREQFKDYVLPGPVE